MKGQGKHQYTLLGCSALETYTFSSIPRKKGKNKGFKFYMMKVYIKINYIFMIQNLDPVSQNSGDGMEG